MITNQEHTRLHLLDVLYWQEETPENRTKARSFDALSLRLESDAEFDTDKATVKTKSRDLAFVPRGCGYTRRCSVDKMIVFHFTMDPPPADNRIIVMSDQNYDVLYPLFKKALAEWIEKAPGYYFRVSAYLNRIFGEIHSQNKTEKQPGKSLILRATGIIKTSFQEAGLSVNSIAQRLHVSEAYLRRVFHRELGQSPKQYITALRLQRARELLNAGYDPISVICEKVGYTDAKNFSTAYKKHFGYPPSAQSYELDDQV